MQVGSLGGGETAMSEGCVPHLSWGPVVCCCAAAGFRAGDNQFHTNLSCTQVSFTLTHRPEQHPGWILSCSERTHTGVEATHTLGVVEHAEFALRDARTHSLHTFAIEGVNASRQAQNGQLYAVGRVHPSRVWRTQWVCRTHQHMSM